MPDESLPPPIGTTPLPPPSLSPEQRELCAHLDELYAQEGRKVKPSKMFEGAVFAIKPECGSNPDRIAQAAHSLREILYRFWSPQEQTETVDNTNTGTDKKKEILKNALERYGSVHIDKPLMRKVWRVYGQLTNLAHHGNASSNRDFSNFTISDFERLLAEFQRVMRDILKRQTDIHEEIDQILSEDPNQIILDNPTAER